MYQIIQSIFFLAAALFVLGKTSSWAVHSSIALSRHFRIPELAISFLIVTAISILPETVISVISALQGVPSLGLGTLLGSNVADLTFVFGVVALAARRPVAVDSKYISKDYIFLAFLMLPLILGFTGHFSRFDGIVLITASVLFMYIMLLTAQKDRDKIDKSATQRFSFAGSFAVLIASLILLGIAATFVVAQGEAIANKFLISPALVGLLVVALGTTLPELLFSVRAVREQHSSLALGDIMGTVIIDATFVLGLTAVISPFSFNPRLIIVTGMFMLLAGFVSLGFLRSGRQLTQTEGFLLLLFYAIFIMVEFTLRNWSPLASVAS